MFLTALGEQDQQAQQAQAQAQQEQEQEPAPHEQEPAQPEDDENMGPPNEHEPDLGGEADSTATQLTDRLDGDEMAAKDSPTPNRRKSGRVGKGTQRDWVSPIKSTANK